MKRTNHSSAQDIPRSVGNANSIVSLQNETAWSSPTATYQELSTSKQVVRSAETHVTTVDMVSSRSFLRNPSTSANCSTTSDHIQVAVSPQGRTGFSYGSWNELLQYQSLSNYSGFSDWSHVSVSFGDQYHLPRVSISSQSVNAHQKRTRPRPHNFAPNNDSHREKRASYGGSDKILETSFRSPHVNGHTKPIANKATKNLSQDLTKTQIAFRAMRDRHLEQIGDIDAHSKPNEPNWLGDSRSSTIEEFIQRDYVLREKVRRKVKRIVTFVAVFLTLMCLLLIGVSFSLGSKIDEMVSKKYHSDTFQQPMDASEFASDRHFIYVKPSITDNVDIGQNETAIT